MTCAPRVVVLGIHKCGTTDLRWALNSIKSVSAQFHEPYRDMKEYTITQKCPKDYFESAPYDKARAT